MAIDSSRPDLDELLQPFFRKIRLRDDLGIEEERAITQAAGEPMTFAAGDDLVREGDRPFRSILMTGGLTCRYRITPSGNRQLTALHIPGDFVDLHSFLLKEMDHAVGALTPCTAIGFPHDRLVTVTERYPHLTRMLWLLTLLDGAIHREWLVGMGRLSAAQRTAHLICETYTRLRVTGLASDLRFNLPITQAALAEAVGISTVHINRVLQELRQSALIAWEGGQVVIKDWDRLATMAEFDDRYLHLVRETR